MSDWNSPTNSTNYANVLAELRTRDEHVAKMDYTGDTNVPSGFRRYNSTSNKFEQYNGSTWSTLGFHTVIDNHIADTAIHTPFPVGMVTPYAGASAPSGWLMADGTAVSRSTYSALFAVCGTTYGAGDGSTTFNLPDLRQRFPLGKAASGTGSVLGQKSGNIDHTHTTPNHQHTIASHAHGMKNHVHNVGAHSHGVPGHQHTVPGHYHDTQGSGASIQIGTASGSHQHNLQRRENGGSYSGDGRVAMPGSGGSTDTAGTTVNNTTSNHTHAHSTFSGTVGNASSGNNGDSGFITDSGNLTTTYNSNDFNTGAPNDNTTDGSGTLTSNSGEGGSNTGAANPPFISLNFIIKT